MPVGFPKRQNPYGPPPFFDPETEEPYGYGATPQPVPQALEQPQGLMGFLDVAGVGQDAPEWIQQEPPQLIEPLAQQGQTPEQAPSQGEDYPSEAAIERRLKLAQTLMGNQQEVHHPLQAVGNAVSQITGAWMERKAERDREKVERQRRDLYKQALSGGGPVDLNAFADKLLASPNTEDVDRGLQIKLALATRGRDARKPPATRTYERGGEKVTEQWNPETEQFEPLATAPRYREGDGVGPDGSARSQKGEWIVLPDGRKKYAEFVPGRGLMYRDDDGTQKPAPPGALPLETSQGGFLNANQYLGLKRKRQEGINALIALDAYAKQAGGLPQGYRRWANDLVARWKTFLAQQGLTQEQFDQLEAPAKQQALLGMLRTTIVGPGVMTEYDAMRVIQAMGGDPRSAMQNPEVLASILADLYDRKRREVQVDQAEYERNAQSFGETAEPLPVPTSIRKPEREKGAAQGGAPAGLPPKDKRPKGMEVTKGGKTFVWTGTGWREKR